MHLSDPSRVRIWGRCRRSRPDSQATLSCWGIGTDTAAKRLQLMARLSRWLAAHELDGANLTAERAEEFLADRRAGRGLAARFAGQRRGKPVEHDAGHFLYGIRHAEVDARGVLVPPPEGDHAATAHERVNGGSRVRPSNGERGQPSRYPQQAHSTSSTRPPSQPTVSRG